MAACKEASKAVEKTSELFSLLYLPTKESDLVEEVEVPMESEDQQSTEATKTSRKRKRDPLNWKVKHVKKLGPRKNAPLVELTPRVKCCKKNCLQDFSVSHMTKLRNDFQALSYGEQNIYLNGLLHRRVTVKTSGHPRKDNPSGKRIGRPPAEQSSFSFCYTLLNDTGSNARVYQKAFCLVYGFGPKRLQVLRKKIEKGGIELDERGKHDNHPAVDSELKELIRDHIKFLPTRQSHYSRKDNPQRVYLSPDLSIARLYHQFLEKHDPEYIKLQEEHKKCVIAHKPTPKLRKPLVSEHLYHDIFVNEFSIHFGYPRTDTCSTCDGFMVQAETVPESEKQSILEALQAHQKLAEEGYHAFRHDRQLSIETWDKC